MPFLAYQSRVAVARPARYHEENQTIAQAYQVEMLCRRTMPQVSQQATDDAGGRTRAAPTQDTISNR